jgi:hypothetical protein
VQLNTVMVIVFIKAMQVVLDSRGSRPVWRAVTCRV